MPFSFRNGWLILYNNEVIRKLVKFAVIGIVLGILILGAFIFYSIYHDEQLKAPLREKFQMIENSKPSFDFTWKHYENSDIGLEISYPENWLVDDKVTSSINFNPPASPELFDTNIFISFDRKIPDKGFDEFIRDSVDYFMYSRGSHPLVIKKNTITINGHHAEEVFWGDGTLDTYIDYSKNGEPGLYELYLWLPFGAEAPTDFTTIKGYSDAFHIYQEMLASMQLH